MGLYRPIWMAEVTRVYGLDIDNLVQQINGFQQTVNQLQEDLQYISTGNNSVMVEQ